MNDLNIFALDLICNLIVVRTNVTATRIIPIVPVWLIENDLIWYCIGGKQMNSRRFA